MIAVSDPKLLEDENDLQKKYEKLYEIYASYKIHS